MNNTVIRDITASDIPTIGKWFEKRKWPLPAIEAIGPDFGVIAEEDGVPVACIHAYLTGRSVAFIEFCGTNPDVSSQTGMIAFDRLIQHFKKMCDHSTPKIRALCLYTQSEQLAARFKKNGFKTEEKYHRALWTLKE